MLAGPRPPAQTAGAPFRPYRFNDELSSAVSISASAAPSAALMSDPLVWRDFFNDKDLTWTLLRGRMGFRQGDMIVKGEGSTPVILAPKDSLIEWSRYEAVEIRMLAEGGNEIKIRVGNQEYRQKIGPLRQYNVYRFAVDIQEPGSRPLAIMPTDGTNDLVAIASIKVIPRKAAFPDPAGRLFLGKRDEYRDALYTHSPSAITFAAPVPPAGRLHFAAGVTEKGVPVTFRVLAEGSASPLYAKTLADPEIWEDADIDLSAYAGKKIRLTFQTDAARKGAVGLWANPLLTTRAPKSRPNVLVYMIDTLRPDHSSLYGYARNTTPFLKKLGESGIVFDDCQAQATWTKPSTASLLTSLYSFTHAIVNDYDTIPSGATTMAAQMRAAGYVTASLIANPFAGRITGLQRGFDYLSDWAVVQRHRKDAVDRGTDSAAVNQVVFPWLDHHHDEPFFLYVHTTDPHAPYRPPAEFEAKFANPKETPAFNHEYEEFRDASQYGGGAVFTRAMCRKKGIDPDQFIQQAMDRYDGEILHNDHSLEMLAGKLKQLGILDNTLIVVVSDHGEEFWEHGWTAHGHTLYQELTHCVLVLWNPKIFRTPRRIAEPAQLIDVMPTVLDLLGLKVPDVAQGQSLAPLAFGRPFQRRGLVMSSRFAHPGPPSSVSVPENHTNTLALLDSNWKLIYRDKAKQAGINRVELYDRRSDRGDKKNVAALHPKEVEERMAEINRWIAAQTRIRGALGKGEKSALDPHTLEQLRSLGYIGGNP
jgi:arylsulfatase A-like enzyme